MNRLLFTFAWIGLTFSGCSSADEKPTEVLTTLGTHRFFDGRMSIDLAEKDGKILCKIKHKIPKKMQDYTEAGPIQPLVEKGPKWFAFPQAYDEVWTFDGRDRLIVTIFGEGHPDNISWSQNSMELHGRKMPRKVRDRLPKEFLEKLEKM